MVGQTKNWINKIILHTKLLLKSFKKQRVLNGYSCNKSWVAMNSKLYLSKKKSPCQDNYKMPELMIRVSIMDR